MRRAICLLLCMLLMLPFAGCKKQREVPLVTSIETTEASQGGFYSAMDVEGHEVYVYAPEDILHADIINYGYTAPLLLVFGDQKLDGQKAVDFICEKGLDVTAQKTGGAVVYVNPLTSWDDEPYGVYERILALTRLDQRYFSNGLLYDKKTDKYHLFNSGAKICVYGYGSGADFIAKNYLKPLSGVAAMSYITGKEADITITAAVLEEISIQPETVDPEIIIVSVNNTTEINNAIKKQSNHFYSSNDRFDEIYEKSIRLSERSDGKIIETTDIRDSGLVQEVQIMEITTSEDNHRVRTPSYQLGAVIFRKEDSTKKQRPLVMCFHGGGDTAILTATTSGWDKLALEEDFILCAIEYHIRTTPTEIMEVIDNLLELYDIDPSRIYATGFSMGSMKTWDLYQEYPERFAGMSPMSGTVRPGLNSLSFEAPRMNENVIVPVFMVGGESSSMAELPFQGRIPVYRIENLFRVNQVDNPFEITNDRTYWPDTIYGFEGDVVEKLTDETHPQSVTTVRYYKSFDGNFYTVLCSISRHEHEIRPFTCQLAWEFMSKFRRNSDGSISIVN